MFDSNQNDPFENHVQRRKVNINNSWPDDKTFKIKMFMKKMCNSQSRI